MSQRATEYMGQTGDPVGVGPARHQALTEIRTAVTTRLGRDPDPNRTRRMVSLVVIPTDTPSSP